MEIIGWPEARIGEAVMLAIDGSGVFSRGVIISRRMFGYVPPEITINVQIKPKIRMIDVDVEIKL